MRRRFAACRASSAALAAAFAEFNPGATAKSGKNNRRRSWWDYVPCDCGPTGGCDADVLPCGCDAS